MFYRWHLFPRQNSFNILHRGGRLFQQFVVDLCVSCEMQRLQYIDNNQDTIRADLYETTREAIRSGAAPDGVGRRILPPTFPGSVRNVRNHFQDSMAIARKLGKPSLFVTFTANPSWKEIQDELLKDSQGRTMQNWRDRPDSVARVFHLKNKAMLEDFKSGKFGQYRGHVQVGPRFIARPRSPTDHGCR